MTTGDRAADGAPVRACQDAVRWRTGERQLGARLGGFSNPPSGASIYYSLKDEDEGEVKIEILDCVEPRGADAEQHPRPSDGSDDEDDTEDLKKAALPPGAGRAARRLGPDLGGGAEDQGGEIDTGDPAADRRRCPAPTPCG